MLENVCFSERVSRFSAQQIIEILKEHEAGLWTAEVCRRHGISGVRHLVHLLLTLPRRIYRWPIHSLRRAMDTREVPDLMTVKEVCGLHAGAGAHGVRARAHATHPELQALRQASLPKRLIELWVAQSRDYPHAATHLAAPPPVIAGSHDPCSNGAHENRNATSPSWWMAVRQACIAFCRDRPSPAVDPATGEYDATVLAKSLPGFDFVVIEWARRQQGLIVAPGNPAKISSIADRRPAQARRSYCHSA